MKRIRFSALFAAVVFAVLSVSVFAKIDVPRPTSEFFINDFADVIDSETEQYIFEKGKEYNARGGPQVVALTMNSIDGEDVESFSIRTAREWGIGSKDANNGVLITLVMDSRDIRVEVGYGLEGVLNDAKCGRFIRNAKDMLSSGDYSGGIRQIYDDVIGELEHPTTIDDEDETIPAILSAIFAIAIFIIWIKMAIYARRHGGWGGFGGFGGSSGGFGGSSGGFGGGFGGGSSGGGFSGGGGSFGGGGASGKF